MDPSQEHSILRPHASPASGPEHTLGHAHLGDSGTPRNVTFCASDSGLVLAAFLVSSSGFGGSRPTTMFVCSPAQPDSCVAPAVPAASALCSIRLALPVQLDGSSATHRTRPQPRAVRVVLP